MSRRPARGTLVRHGEARCFIEGFKEWLEASGKEFPQPAEAFMPELVRWMSLESTMNKYRDQVGLWQDEATGAHELRYVTLEFNSSFTPPKSQKRTEAVYKIWEEVMLRANGEAPRGSRRASSPRTSPGPGWSPKRAGRGVKLGVTLVMVIAFVVINLSTLNVIVSIGAILAIGGIVATTMGYGVQLLMSYPLGVAESIATVILIGFSMDYCLHLAGAYIASKKATRQERTRESLTEMGVSVTAGALTTVFSAVFLFGTVLTFFQKFAFIIIFTIGGSWLWSTVFFSSFCMVFGPEGDFGEWLYILGQRKAEENGKEAAEVAEIPDAERGPPRPEILRKRGRKAKLFSVPLLVCYLFFIFMLFTIFTIFCAHTPSSAISRWHLDASSKTKTETSRFDLSKIIA